MLEKTAITYLIKHNQKIPTQPEQRDKFDKLYRKTEIQIERLEKQIEARLPKGRNLSDQQWLNTLITASQNVPKDENEAKLWQKYLLTDSKSLPYPVSYETNENLVWSLDNQGRICVRFNGLSKLTFKVYCDNRQLHYFQQFLQDQTIKKSGKNRHSSGLFLVADEFNSRCDQK
ncbi:type V CRISPR-associated protein Cas12k [Cyanobacterium sp. Dongsha4]|nr:type V CRISPR-associated protein Cas12k [Cyanobacterium sp. Dongsha4]